MVESPWNDELVTRLKELWDKGESTSVIAEELSRDVVFSRNAIIGKVHRLGLSGRVDRKWLSSVSRPGRPRSERVVRRKLKAINGTKFAMMDEVSVVPNPTSAPPPTEVVVPMPRRPLWELEPGACRWLEGNGRAEGFWYTCHEKAVRGCWCAFHRAIVYRRP